MHTALIRSLVGLMALFIAPLALAGLFNVSPAKVILQPGERASSVDVVSSQKQDMLLRAEVMRWSRNADGEDVYEPSSELVATPPVFRLAGGSRQVLRIGFLGRPRPVDVEASYRVYLREVDGGIPDAEQQTRTENGITFAINTLLNLDFPVFVEPKKPIKALTASARKTESGWQLVVNNTGTVYLKLTRLRLVTASGQELVLNNQFLVALAQSKGVLALGALPELTGQPVTLRYVEEYEEKTLPL